MSTGVSDQRMRGQGPSQATVPKEQVNDHEDFASWRNQSIQSYAAPSVAQGDPYLSSYYGNSFPYHLDGAWSSSAAGVGDGEVAFLSGYGAQGPVHQDSYGIDGMFGTSGSFGNFGQPAFSAGYGFHGNGGAPGEYSTWERKAHYDDYYQRSSAEQSVYQTSTTRPDESSMSVKQVEQGMQGLALDNARQDGGGKANAVVAPSDAGVVQQQQQQQSGNQPKKLTWASIASQPAKPQLATKKKSMVPPPMVTPRTPSLDIGTWENKSGSGGGSNNNTSNMNSSMAYVSAAPVAAPVVAAPAASSPTTAVAPVSKAPLGPPAAPLGTNRQPPPPAATAPVYHNPSRPPPSQRSPSSAILPPMGRPSTSFPPPNAPPSMHAPPPMVSAPPPVPAPLAVPAAVAPVAPAAVAALNSQQSNPILEELQSKHNYNPKEFDLSAKNARFFVIKSYSEDDIHRSIKYEIWCSTEHGNKRLDVAFREREGKGPVYLYFSVNGSGHFCGMAEMTSAVDMSATLSVWSQDKWRGQFTVKWIYVKDVPNAALRHIRLENNENKPVTNSRDTQEVPAEKGRQVLKILHTYRHETSIFDDFTHYEKRQAEEDQRKTIVQAPHEPHYEPRASSTRQDRGGGGGGDHRDREPYRSDRDSARGRAEIGSREFFQDRDGYRDRDNRNQRDGYRDRADRDPQRSSNGSRGGGGNRGRH